jgi:hypothetical protein
MNMEYNMAVSDPYVIVKTKIFLQGPYNTSTDEMTTTLKTGGYIPTTSPYSEDARTASVPADVTDWVLVQLRSTANGIAVASRSAFLHKDGRIVADDGTTNEINITASVGSYYVVIKHRNHLPVMSKNSVPLNSSSSTLYDFTSSSDKYYGTNGTKELETGVWGMWAGNAMNDKVINAGDRLEVFNNSGTINTYLNADVTLDKIVNAGDRLMTLNNVGSISSVP